MHLMKAHLINQSINERMIQWSMSWKLFSTLSKAWFFAEFWWFWLEIKASPSDSTRPWDEHSGCPELRWLYVQRAHRGHHCVKSLYNRVWALTEFFHSIPFLFFSTSVPSFHLLGFADTPKRYRLIHIASWVLNLFGMFFILAAHEVTSQTFSSKIFFFFKKFFFLKNFSFLLFFLPRLFFLWKIFFFDQVLLFNFFHFSNFWLKIWNFFSSVAQWCVWISPFVTFCIIFFNFLPQSFLMKKLEIFFGFFQFFPALFHRRVHRVLHLFAPVPLLPHARQYGHSPPLSSASQSVLSPVLLFRGGRLSGRSERVSASFRGKMAVCPAAS